MTPDDDLPYRFGRSERRGLVVGWRPGQALAAAAAVGALLLGLGATAAPGVAAGVVSAILLAVVAVVPVRGRGIDEWAPVVACFLARPRRGALCAGAAVVDASGAAPAHLRWPDGTATCVAMLGGTGLRALSDEPRAVGEALAAWLRTLGAPGASARTTSLLTTTGPGVPPRDARWAGGGMAAAALVAVSSSDPVDVASELRAVGIDGVVPLGVPALESMLAARVAPTAGTILGCETVARWRLLEAPASVHAAFLVEEWPAGDVDEQALAALCVSRDRRTVALHLSVEELGRARERVATARTKAAADASIAEGGGFLASPRAALEHARDAERAAELAAGHGAVRLIGVIAIDAIDVLALEVAAARLVADAAGAGIRLRRCDGDHRRGVLSTVPGWCVP